MPQGAFRPSFVPSLFLLVIQISAPMSLPQGRLPGDLSEEAGCFAALVIAANLHLGSITLSSRTEPTFSFFFISLLANTAFVFTLAKYQYVIFMERLLSVCLHPAPA